MENEKRRIYRGTDQEDQKNDRSLRKIKITENKKKTQYSNEGFTEKGMETFWILCFSFCFVYAKTSDFS